jgi:hypothetical protein
MVTVFYLRHFLENYNIKSQRSKNECNETKLENLSTLNFKLTSITRPLLTEFGHLLVLTGTQCVLHVSTISCADL